MEKRRQAAEDAKVQREKALADASSQDPDTSSALDSLLDKLRNGDGVGRRARRNRRPSASVKQSSPLALSAEGLLEAARSGDGAADLARNMLAQLKSDGFETLLPSSPTRSTTSRSSTRRSRRKLDTTEFTGIAEELNSSPIFNIQEPSFDESQELEETHEDGDEPPEDGDGVTAEGEPGDDEQSVLTEAVSDTLVDESHSTTS